MKPQREAIVWSVFRRRLRLAVTKFRRADEVADAAHAAVVLSLRLVELHADPLTAGELCSPTKPQSAGLRDKASRLRVAQTQDSKLKTSNSLTAF